METIEKEIETLEEKIKEETEKNNKNSKIRNMKIFKENVKRFAPHLLADTLIVFTVFAFSIPFYRDETIIEKPKYVKEIDSNGNNLDIDYKDVNFPEQSLEYYSKWEQTKDGTYKRNVKIWNIDAKYNEEILMALLEKENVSLEDAIGEPDNQFPQIANKLSEKELKNNEEYIRATMFSGTEKVIIKEGRFDNIMSTLFIFFAPLSMSFYISSRRDKKNYNYKKIIQKIKEKYPEIDIEPLLKELEEKQKEYKKLTRK